MAALLELQRLRTEMGMQQDQEQDSKLVSEQLQERLNGTQRPNCAATCSA